MSKKKPPEQNFDCQPVLSPWQQWRQQKTDEYKAKFGDVPYQVLAMLQTHGIAGGKLCADCKYFKKQTRPNRSFCQRNGRAWKCDYPACGLIEEK